MSRLTQLEDAHRALAAQHAALMETCRALLPLISSTPEVLQQVLAETYARSNLQMARAAMDDEFQTSMRKWLAILFADVSAGRTYPCSSTAFAGATTRSS
jgi:hypothetical protein